MPKEFGKFTLLDNLILLPFPSPIAIDSISPKPSIETQHESLNPLKKCAEAR